MQKFGWQLTAALLLLYLYMPQTANASVTGNRLGVGAVSAAADLWEDDAAPDVSRAALAAFAQTPLPLLQQRSLELVLNFQSSDMLERYLCDNAHFNHPFVCYKFALGVFTADS